MNKKAVIIGFSCAILLSIAWLFIVPAPKEKIQQAIILDAHTNGLKKRILNYSKQETLFVLDGKYLGIYKDAAEALYFLPYAPNEDYDLLSYTKNNEKIKLAAVPLNYTNVFIHNETINGLAVDENDGVTLCLKNKNISKLIRTGIPFDYTCQVDDSSIYILTKHTNKEQYYLSRYNFFKNKCVDSLGLNELFPADSNNLNMVLFGRILVDKNTIVYKSIYSSYGLILDKNNFSKHKKFQSIDSLPLPRLKINTLAEGIEESVIEPILFPALQFEKTKYGYCILSRIGLKKNTSYIDCYSRDMNYLFSFEIPNIRSTIQAYAIKFSEDQHIFYVLYDDHISVAKFTYHV